MFFSAGRNIDLNFEHTYSAFGWQVVTDQGWTCLRQQQKLILFKGYCDQFALSTIVDNAPVDVVLTGNFCIITLTATEVSLTHNLNRSFPLWANENKITNFPADRQDLLPVWADTAVTLTSDNKLKFASIPVGPESVETTTLTITQLVNQTITLLQHRAAHFKKQHQLPINIYCSGGVDTALTQALCNNAEIQTTGITGPIVSTKFVKTHQSTLKHFWAYQQLHHWDTDSCIVTGSHGDEYFLRGPDAISMITAWHNIDFLSLLDQNPDCYHFHYFNRPANRNKFQQQYQQRSQLLQRYPTWEKLCSQVINMLRNDHQHWHLGPTVTWTPLKEIIIAQWCLQLSIDDLLDNFLNATVTKQCIMQLDSNLINTVDQYKNTPK